MSTESIDEQALRDVFNKYGLNYSQIVGDENTVISTSLFMFNKALKDICDLIKQSQLDMKIQHAAELSILDQEITKLKALNKTSQLEARIDELSMVEEECGFEEVCTFLDGETATPIYKRKADLQAKLKEPKAKITKIGFVENGTASGWDFDCGGLDIPALDTSSGKIAGYTIKELEEISKKEEL